MTKKTPLQISQMREDGHILGAILKNLIEEIKPGDVLLDIDQHAEQLIREAGGSPSFQTVEGYKWTTCLCVNEAVVHGIPTKYVLKDGDVLTVDIGMLKHDLHTDTAWTVEVGHNKHEKTPDCVAKQRFLKVGQTALSKALELSKPGNRIGHISQCLQETVESAGFSIVKSLIGHGIGKALHEAPQVPGFLKGSVEETQLLVPGLTIAIEVIYAQGKGTVVYDRGDGWTISTRDQSLSSVFEHSVAITADGPLVLTEPNI